jgi:hypothetical protein
MGKKERRQDEISFTHPGVHGGFPGAVPTGMAQPELIEAAKREAALSTPASAPRHPHRGIEEQLSFLKGELGRTKRRVRQLEARALEHRHEDQQPALRNGMYIDGAGTYWMRRPDGWHYCFIIGRAGVQPGGGPTQPSGQVQRLAEPKS